MTGLCLQTGVTSARKGCPLISSWLEAEVTQVSVQKMLKTIRMINTYSLFSHSCDNFKEVIILVPGLVHTPLCHTVVHVIRR